MLAKGGLYLAKGKSGSLTYSTVEASPIGAFTLRVDFESLVELGSVEVTEPHSLMSNFKSLRKEFNFI
jgi:hypothetical protein